MFEHGVCATGAGAADAGGVPTPGGVPVGVDGRSSRAAPVRVDSRQDAAGAALEALEGLTRHGEVLAGLAAGCAQWSGGQRGTVLAGLDHLAGVLATVRAGLLVAEQDAGTMVRPGDRDFEAARARVTRAGFAHTRREVRQARTLVGLPAVAEAVQAGQVPLAHVDVLARVAAGATGAGAAVLTSPEGQARVVEMARRQPVKEFAASLAQLVAAHDPAGVQAGHDAQHRARFFTMSHQPDGTFLRGRLDRMSGEVLRVALLAVGQAPDADRDRAQADADALVALAERATSGMAGVRPRKTGLGGDTAQDLADSRVSGVANRPTVSLLVPAEVFAELRAHHRRLEHIPPALGRGGRAGDHDPASGGRSAASTGDTPAPGTTDQGAGGGSLATDSGNPPPGTTDPASTAAAVTTSPGGSAFGLRSVGPGWAPVAPATLEDGTPVAMSELARALCDCEVTRIVISGDGLPLDLGRTQRLYTGAHRRAVIIRDRHCAWNGCEVPPAFCEVHHIRWWDRDLGPTSIANGVLLCTFHHHQVHTLDLTVQRLTARPAGIGGALGTAGAPSRAGSTGRAGPLGEPIRYVFRRRDQRTINAPPDHNADPPTREHQGRPMPGDGTPVVPWTVPSIRPPTRPPTGPAAHDGTPLPPTGRAAPLDPTGRAAPLDPTGRAAPLDPTGRAAPLDPTGRAAPPPPVTDIDQPVLFAAWGRRTQADPASGGQGG